MFGKINLAGNTFNKNYTNKQTTPSNYLNSNLPKKTHENKSVLTNPRFVVQNKKREDAFKIDEQTEKKQQLYNQTTQKYPPKTKPIQKAPLIVNSSKKNEKNKGNVQSSIQQKMQGSKFRILNQLLYTSNSQQAMEHFKQNPEDYKTYHEGYRYQSEKWESKPVNMIIKHFRKSFKNYKDKIICDLGCGQGFLFQGLTKQKYSKLNQQGLTIEVYNKHIFNRKNIFSYDLVSMKPFVKVADIKNLPLQKNSVDVVVFCLSLMGKNYLEFIQQAQRVLKQQSGELIIAEVQSRSKNWKTFVDMIEMVGFQLINNGVSMGSKIEYGHNEVKRLGQNKGKYFRILHFTKCSTKIPQFSDIRFQNESYTKQNLAELSQLLLTECIYKKR